MQLTRRAFFTLAPAFALTICVALSNASAQPGGAKGDKEDSSKSMDNDAAAAARWLQAAFDGQEKTEAVEMLLAIAKGSKMGLREGWFHPGQSRHDWKWLAQRHDIPVSGSITRDAFQGPADVFARLDRNKDGELRAEDFDLWERMPFTMQAWMAGRWFRKLNTTGDGWLTREEWLKFFDDAALGKDALTAEGLRDAIGAIAMGGMGKSDMPSQQALVRGLFRGEIGSIHEGPKLNDYAPDFTLKTRDGKQTIRLGDHIGKKPIVLVFGNYTCGPFRQMYPRVDELAQLYKDDALFLGVYVREAHPTNGWRMGSNDDAGVSLAQPKNYSERAAVANTCSLKIKMSIPLLVDEMDDRVGHAYSGMPSRLYIIDRAGKVAYKAGRGPFGFKADEMEQSLLMLLMAERNAEVIAPPSLDTSSGERAPRPR